MTIPTPVQLPLTREQALERWLAWFRSPMGRGTDDQDFEDLAAAWGLTFTEPVLAPPPEPRWPAKLVVRRGDHARLLRAADDEDWYFALSTPDHLDEAAVAEEARRRWSRCPELEAEAAELRQQVEREIAGWRRSAGQVIQGQQRIDALLGTLAERTRERDEALRRAEYDRNCLGEVFAERDAARQEAAELRRRCAYVAGRLADGDFRYPFVLWNEILSGQRPVPGSEGGSGA